jgi:hypothetical protein
MKLLIGNTIVLLMLSSPATHAEEAAPLPVNGPIPFSAFDTNHDGSVSEQEFNAVRSQRLLQKAEEGRPMRGAATAPGFADLDTNKDGKLSPEELAQGQQQRMQNRPGPGGAGPGGGMGPGSGMGRGRANMPTFADIDTNHDGCISPDEFAEHQRTHQRPPMTR